MKFLHLKPQMQPLSIRSSDIAFTMGAKGPLWERVKHFDGEIPLFRERETRKMKESIIYVHGKGGSAEEADHYKPLFPNCEVIGFDYRSQTPWEAKEEFLAFFAQQRQRCDRLILIAGSIGAFFSMSVLDETLVDRAYFISPVVDMENLIGNMMRWANVTEQELAEKKEIATDFGETLSWRYLCYVRAHPISWNVPTQILYGEHDNLTSMETVSAFAKRHHAKLTVMPGGEHWFHTEEQMQFLDHWLKKEKTQAMSVRYAELSELPRVNELRMMVSGLHAEGRPDIFRVGFCEELQHRVYQAFESSGADVIVACVENEPRAFAVVQYIDKPESAYMRAQHFYHIEEFGVDESYRRCGIGTALLCFCKAQAKQRGFDRVTLDVWTFNESAQKFYAAAGFQPYRCFWESQT